MRKVTAPHRALDVLAAALVALAAPALFVARSTAGYSWVGYLALAIGLAVATATNRLLARDLALIAVPLLLISFISVEANLEWGNIALMGTVLIVCVVFPYVMS